MSTSSSQRKDRTTGNCQSEVSATNLLLCLPTSAGTSFIALHAEQSAGRSVQITMVDTPSACLLNPKRERGQIQREHRDNESSLFCRSLTLRSAPLTREKDEAWLLRTRSFRKKCMDMGTDEIQSLCTCVHGEKREGEKRKEFVQYLFTTAWISKQRKRERERNK